MEPPPKALENCQLRSIPHWITVRMERGRELQADDRRDSCRQVDGQGAQLAAFCALGAVLTDAHPPGDFADAQSSGRACIRQLVRDALTKHSTSLCADRGDAFPTWHVATIEAGTYPLLIPS